MHKQYMSVLLAAIIFSTISSSFAETPFFGSDVEVTDDGCIPSNNGSGAAPQDSGYTVISGDSLSVIADRFLGSAMKYAELINLNADRYPSMRNNPDLIYPGWNITLTSGTKTPSKPSTGAGVYIVTSGDTLSGIAQKCLGDGRRYMEIVNLNAERYPSLRKNPNLIRTGWKLALPPGAKHGSNSSSTTGNTTTSNPGAGESAELNSWSGGKLSPSRFCAILGPVAAASFRTTGVPASVTLAQAALETGWGRSTIGDAKNLFGIKGRGPAGSLSVPTKEFVNGREVTVNASFRKYHTWQESVDDHARLITQASRYANCMNYKNDPDQFARELQKAGYATDAEYASKLIKIMRSYNLYQYDR